MERIIEAIELQIADLKKHTRDLLDQYWDFHVKTNKEKKYAEKSVLGVRMKELNDTLYIEWFWNKWLPAKDQNESRRPLSQHIKRGRTLRYPDAALIRHAQPWEIDMVLELEGQFADIRRQAHYLVKSRVSAREAMRVRDRVRQARSD